jgi:hypothetical protein
MMTTRQDLQLYSKSDNTKDEVNGVHFYQVTKYVLHTNKFIEFKLDLRLSLWRLKSYKHKLSQVRSVGFDSLCCPFGYCWSR